MKKLISLILAALLALSTLTAAFAATYTDKDTVKKVQQALNDAGYECGTPNGIAGKKTAALTQFETDRGLEANGAINDGEEREGQPVEEAESTEEAEPSEEAEPVKQANPGEQIDEIMSGAKDLYYKQGEDLLIGEKDGFRVTLKGEQPDYGNYIENWEAYQWYTLEIKNDTDKTYSLELYSQIDGTVVDNFMAAYSSTGFVGYSTEECEIYLNADDFVNEKGEMDENAWLSAGNSPREWRLVVKICEAEVDGYVFETIGTLTTLNPVIIHFDSPEAAEPGTGTETVETGAAAPARVYTDKDTVKKVQQALNDAGYNCGTPDGIAGKKTAAAITQYRTDKGLEVSDTIDDALLEALGLAEAPDEAKADPEHAEADVPSQEDAAPSRSIDTTEVATLTPESLYTPQTFMTAWQNLLYDTGISVFAETGAEAIAEKWVSDYYAFEPEGFDTYSVPNAWSAKLHFSFYVDADKNGSEQPEGIMMMFTGRTENMLDAWDCLAAKAFLFYANFLYGGSEEDWNSLYKLFGDTTPETKLSTEDWIDASSGPVFECEKYVVQYRRLGTWSENQLGFDVIAN